MIATSVREPSAFEQAITKYMTRDVVTVSPDAPIAAVVALMDGRRISCVPVVDRGGRVQGVISRSDLVALGALQSGSRRESPAMPLPHRKAVDVMTARVITAPSTASVRTAAQLMAGHAIHHVVVVDADRLVGIISAIDIAVAVRDAQVSAPLSTIMTTPAITIDVETSLGTAIDLLARVRVTGLIVFAYDQPVGTFTQSDALAARDLPRSTPLEAVYEPVLVCLPQQTSLRLAATKLARFEVRRIVCCDQRSAVGVATSLDFARYVAW